MRRRTVVSVLLAVGAIAAAVARIGGDAAAAVPFKEARLIAEINDTDGDAGLQIFLDHEPWRQVAIARPDGTRILDVQTKDSLREYGLTELFSESSEPPFDTFPLSGFQRLFPEGAYTFTGETIDGTAMESKVHFSHDFPDGPRIKAPKEDSTIDAGSFVVRWGPGDNPSGVRIKGYQVLVVKEKPRPVRVFSADLPADARSLRIPAQFVQSGIDEYKVEVLAIDVSGNQTLSEIAFSTR